MDMFKDIFKIDIKNFNVITVIAILFLLAGIFHYIYWIVRYGVIFDIGIYSITSVMVIAGIVGILLSLMEKEED